MENQEEARSESVGTAGAQERKQSLEFGIDPDQILDSVSPLIFKSLQLLSVHFLEIVVNLRSRDKSLFFRITEINTC